MPATDGSSKSRILAALPAADHKRIAAHLEPCALERGHILHEHGAPIRQVYFPADAIVSLLLGTKNGNSTETAVVGNEGVVGVSGCLGKQTAFVRAQVQTGGKVWRLDAAVFKREFERSGALRDYILRYTQTLLAQMAQNTVCNRHHSLEQQLCRWLLLSLDRLPSNQIRMTQETIANMLGVRRVGVTEAAGKLQTAGMIQYRRGHINILNRAKLEACACECYAVIRQEFDRQLDFEPRR